MEDKSVCFFISYHWFILTNAVTDFLSSPMFVGSVWVGSVIFGASLACQSPQTTQPIKVEPEKIEPAPSCPSCGGRMVEIRCGKPGKQLQQEAREGLVVLRICSPGKEVELCFLWLQDGRHNKRINVYSLCSFFWPHVFWSLLLQVAIINASISQKQCPIQ